MIILKYFFRKKTTKLSLVIISILFCIILLLFSFTKFYQNYENNIYKENVYILVTSKVDIINILKRNKNVLNANPVIKLKVDNKENKKIFETLLYDIDNDFILAEENSNLGNDEFILLTPKERYDMYSLDLYNKVVTFINAITTANLKCIEIKNFNYSRINISKNMFQKLADKNFNYAITIKDYSLIDALITDLKKDENIIYVSEKQGSTGYEKVEAIRQLSKVVKILEKSSIAISAVFSILLILILFRNISESFDVMHLESVLGYNQLKIKMYIIAEIILLISAASILSIMLYIIIGKLITLIWDINILNLSLEILIQYLICLIISIFLILIKNIIKNEKGLAKKM